MPESSKINVEEIKLIETTFNPLVDLNGPICEEWEVHNYVNGTQVFFSIANLLSLWNLHAREKRGANQLINYH
jgi:hypothetical protein